VDKDLALRVPSGRGLLALPCDIIQALLAMGARATATIARFAVRITSQCERSF